MLYLIKGRAGSGKTTWVRERIKDIIEANENKPLLLVPDQFSFENERSMLTLLGAKNLKKIDVFSFPRLATYNLDSKILQGKMFADDGVRMAYMSEALSSLQDNLKVFSKVRHNVSGLQSFIDLNRELESCAISGVEIESIVENMKPCLLKDKLYEINLINDAYNALLHRSYFDDTECLKYFNEFADETGFFKNKIVFLDSFKTFSAQEIKCITIALRQAKDVYITLCTDDYSGEGTPFNYIKKVEERVKREAAKCGVEVKIEKLQKNKNDVKASISHIEENIYCDETEKLEDETDGVTIFKCRDLTDECNMVALEIKKLIRSGKYRCKDIAVIERSDDKYKRVMCDVLKRYGVPVFEDCRRPLSFETLFIHITSALECISDGFKTENVMRYLKTGLSGIPFRDVAKLEKYVLIWNISGNAWLNDFTMHPDGFGKEIDDDAKLQIEKLNNIRKKAILPLFKLKKDCDGASGLEISKLVYEFLIETEVDDNLYNLSCALNDDGLPVEALQKENSWDALIEILDTISEITKDKYYTLKRWFELLSILVFSKDIGEIPQGLDEVKIGSADRIRTENIKVVFLMGVNKNEFPRVSTVGGLLSDSDRRILTSLDLEIRPPFEETIDEERFIAYCMLTAPSEELYLSYREVSEDETTSGPSEIIEQIKEFLPQVKIISSDEIPDVEKIESEFSAFFTLAKMYNENTQLRQTLYEYIKNNPQYSDRIKSINYAKNGKKGEFNNPENSKKLFGENIGVSASRLDSFYKCSFSFLCRYGLRIEDLKTAELKPTDSGTIIHGVLEEVLKTYKDGEFLKISEDELRAFIAEYLKNYLNEKMGGFQDKSKRFMYIYNRMIDVLLLIFERLKNEFSAIDFKPVDFELSVGGDKIPQYTLPLSDGNNISVYGSVDRVDLYEKDGIKYLRVIDYKTGKKEFKLSHLLDGINLQMVLYLMAITKNGKAYYGETVPAGVLYLPSRIGYDKYLKTRNPSDENIEAQKRSSGKLSGMVLDSPVVINAMGGDVFPDYLPVSYKKDGSTKGNFYSQKHFNKLSEIVDSKIIGMGEILHNGKFNVLPTGSSNSLPCSYCEYRPVCGYEDCDDFTKLSSDKHEAILEMLEGDDNE